MEVANCPRCKKVFTQILSPICPSCVNEEEQTFQILRKFIYENYNCTLNELSESTGVSPKKIMRYIREGRLEISKGMRGDVRCEACYNPILQGRYCDACKIQLNQNITDMFSNTSKKLNKDDSSSYKTKQGTKMHISKNSKK